MTNVKNKTAQNYCLTFLLVSLLKWVSVESSSVLNTNLPIVIFDSDTGSRSEDNLFAYALTWSTIGALRERAHGTLYIGSPNEKKLSKNSGIVWRCDFSGNGDLKCSPVTSISSQDTAGRCAKRFSFPENETEQWLGGSLSANNKYIFACGPRYKLNSYMRQMCNPETAMIGACYLVDAQEQVTILAPFESRRDKFYYEARNSQNEIVNAYWLHYAEFGFSIASRNDRFFVGSPNARSWSGSFAEYTNEFVETIYNEYGDLSEIQEQSYLGYSITSGEIQRGRGGYFVAAGAPRANDLKGVVVIAVNRQRRKFFYGEEFGGYFGYSVATADLNGDGTDELLVGAPWQFRDSGCVYIYYATVSTSGPQAKLCQNSLKDLGTVSRTSKFGSSIINLGDLNNDVLQDFAVGAPFDDSGIGSVVIFYGHSRLSAIRPSQIIKGRSFEIPNLRGFGTYLLGGANVDVDGNKTPDLAIGAYKSRHVLVLRTRPIASAFLTLEFRSDDEQSNDVRIVKFLPNQDKVRVRVCVTFKFSNNPPPDLKLNAWLKSIMDHHDKRFSPGVIERSYEVSATDPTCIDQTYTLTKEIGENNDDITFVASIWYNETAEIDSSGMFHATMPISSSPQQRSQFVQDQSYKDAFRRFYPFLPIPIPESEPKAASLPIAQDNCKRNREGNPECEPKLQLKFNLQSVTVSGKKTALDSTKPLVIGEVDSLNLLVTLENLGETAYQPTLVVTLKMGDNVDFGSARNLLRYHWTPGKVGQKQCPDTLRNGVNENNNNVTHFLWCSRPLQGGKKMEYVWTAENLKVLKARNDRNGKISLKVEAFPDIPGSKTRYRVEQNVVIPLKANVEIDVQDPMSSSTTQSVVNPRSSVVDLTQFYIVKNSGFSSTLSNDTKIEIWVPAYSKKSTRILGIVDPSDQLEQNLRCTGNFYNPSSDLGNKMKNKSPASSSTSSTQSRITRSTKGGETKGEPNSKVTKPTALITTSDENLIFLSGCEPGSRSGHCEKITCVTDLPSKSSKEIRLKMYLLSNGTDELVEEDSTGIRVETVVSVSYLNRQIKTIVGRTERKFILVRGVPAYVYLLSAAGGTIIFLLITFILFKCGFFRRKTKEELQKLKRQTMMMQGGGAGEVLQLPELEENALHQD